MTNRETCSVEGCGQPFLARGLCSKHWRHARSEGTLAGRPRWPRGPAPGDPTARFWAKVNKTDSCWLWLGHVNNKGYGTFYVSASRRHAYAHRTSYEWAKGPIQEGLVLDHLCRTPACVNPDHLEAVTQYVNVQRGESLFARNMRATHCPQGHEYTPDNIVRRTTGTGRSCLTCGRIRSRERKSA